MFDIVNPRQVVIATCRGTAELFGKESERDNGITLSWHSPLSFKPPLYGILVGKSRFSHKLISESKVFVVNFLLHEHKEDALLFGRVSGRTTDKFKDCVMTKEEAEAVDCCRLKEAAAFFECEVIDEVEVGDHTMFVGKVLKSRQNNESKRLFYKGDDVFTSTI